MQVTCLSDPCIIPAWQNCQERKFRSSLVPLSSRTPEGIRYSVLVEKISQQNPETPKNTIHGAVRWVTIIFLRCGKPVLLVEPLCTLPFTNFVPSWPFLDFVPFIVKTPR